MHFRLLGLVMLLSIATGAMAQDVATFPIGQLDQMLGDKIAPNSVVGTPIQVGGMTLIPVVSKGFAFGAAEGEKSSEGPQAPANHPGARSESVDHEAYGGIGFVRPVSLIVIDKEGHLQIHNLNSNFLIELIERLMPLAQAVLAQRFEMIRQRMMGGPGSGSGK
jgi:uncharacterized spore protein YtfJ